MLLFYEDEPDANYLDCKQCPKRAHTTGNQTIDPLAQYGSYAFFPYLPPTTPLTTCNPSEKKIKSLALNNTSSWTYCGPLLPSDSAHLPPSFHTWSAKTTSNPSILLDRLLPLLSFLQTFLSAAQVQHYWLTIRATKPTAEYDSPRWHTDDDFFDVNFGRNDSDRTAQDEQACKKRHWKLATTLLGPGTLFLEENRLALHTLRKAKAQQRFLHAHECTSTRCLGCATYASSLRTQLNTSLRTYTHTSPSSHEISFFRIGDDEGAVHSEPECKQDRIFVNVVPGSEDELRRLTGRWGMGFPRAWCLGVSGGGVRSDEAESW